MARTDDAEVITVDGHEVRITHPGKAYFTSGAQLTKLDVVRYYLAVAVGAVNGIRDRPIVLKRFVKHLNVRIQQRWSFIEVRRAALAFSREIERRAPGLATSKWWKEERHGVFLDYNQNAKDRTTCSAYSVRPVPGARVSAPLTWEEVPACDPRDFTVATLPARYARIGDPHAEMDRHPGSLDALLELAARDEAGGLGDAPWPPHFRKTEGEGKRVAPSRAKGSGKKKGDS